MAELIFPIDRNSQIPMYHQVYQYIRTQIASGKLPHGTRLPSIRELARQLDVSRNTTQLAYDQLLSEGYLRSEHKKGFFVEAKISDSVFAYERTPDTADPVVPTNRHHIDFRTGTVDQDSFPLAKWRRHSNKIMNDPSLYSYGDKQGDTELRRELENYLFQSRGVQASADQIIIGAGTKSLLLMLLLMLRSHHVIAVEDPGYDLSRKLFILMGFEVHPTPVTSSGIHTEELRQSPATLLYTTPTHHYPTGVTMPVNQRLDLLRWNMRWTATSSKMTMTANSATSTSLSPLFKAWTIADAPSSWEPSQKPFFPRSGSAIWSCRQACWRCTGKTQGYLNNPLPPSIRRHWPVS
jgi:GntR family transcriptional regulator / MocR family aminotransferase